MHKERAAEGEWEVGGLADGHQTLEERQTSWRPFLNNILGVVGVPLVQIAAHGHLGRLGRRGAAHMFTWTCEAMDFDAPSNNSFAVVGSRRQLQLRQNRVTVGINAITRSSDQTIDRSIDGWIDLLCCEKLFVK